MARGFKSGGRTKGTPNKANIERALIAEQVVARAEMRGEKLGKEYLNDFVKVFAGIAAYYQPTFPGMPTQNPHGNEDKFERWAVHAVKCAKDLADFQSPRLKAVMVATSSGMGSAEPSDGNVVPAGDPVRAARVYRMLIDGAPARKVG